MKWLILLLLVLMLVIIYRKLIWSWCHWFLAKKVMRYDFKWNPYVKYPVNYKCYCGSGRKYKKCCLNGEPEAIRADIAEKATKIIKGIRTKKKNG